MALQRTIAAARAKREARGVDGDGRVVVSDLSSEEALALDGLLTPRRPLVPGMDLRVALSQLETALRAAGIDPLAAYEQHGGPLRDLPAEREARRQERGDFHAWLRDHPAARARPAVGAWLAAAADRGRLQPADRLLVERALTIVGALPDRAPCQRAVLAAELLDGDPHGLDPATALHTLVVDLLAAQLDQPGLPPREVWAAHDVLVDPVSSNVTCLNLRPAGDGRLARMLRLMHGTHVVLTYGQLAAEPLTWPRGLVVRSCENPSVLIAAERALGADCPPLLCTAGRPSDAVRLLLASLAAAGAQLHHHGDGDDAGEQILADLAQRYGAQRWGEPAPGVCEELVIDALIDDLRR